MNLKQISLTCLICTVLGAFAGYKLHKPETKTIEVEKEVVKKDVVTQVKVITLPDGTKTETTVITDRSTENKESSKNTIVAKKDWHVSAGATVTNISDNLPTYQLTVERRILSDFTLGITARTDKSAGVVLGFSF